MSNTELLELAERLTDRQRADILVIADAEAMSSYGGCFDAFSADDYAALRSLGLIRPSHIPAGCMAPLIKLSPKGREVAAALRTAQSEVSK